ncbi:SidA/IucD/PvdA family monooxygenase [Candidatus Poribacteria bacterium]|nr:SidA/IucD/PvdA family monooxygenase [Candidatus Poribacteria bacterium]
MLNLSHQNIPIAIIGGGIHGVSLAMRILRDMPRAAKHLVILDGYPQPLTGWRRKTEGQGMAFLRSPAVHHISTDPLGVVEYARGRNRTDELAPPYSQPSADLFLDFCLHEIERQQIGRFYYPFDVATLRWDKGSGRFPFRVISQRNEGFRARCVILAVGSDDFPYISPEFASWRRRFPERILHSRDFDLRTAPHPEKIVIIGGGLTAGTLAKNLVENGSRVVLMTRKPLRIQQFDFEPVWLGPKSLREFSNEPDWEKRYEIIQRVRGEGSVTPEIADALTRYAMESRGAEGKPSFVLYTGAKILHIDQPEQAERLRIDTTQGPIEDVELVILATGYRFDLRRYPFLSDLIEQHNIPILHGLPLLDECLQLRPVENLFTSGVITQLQLGPAAGNIAGAALAYERLREKVLKAIPTSL